MRGPKHEQLLKLIAYLNIRVPELKLPEKNLEFFQVMKEKAILTPLFGNNGTRFHIVPLDKDQSQLGSNAWLTGFIDADGSFQVRTSLQSKIQKRLAVSFELHQARMTRYGLSNLPLMQIIAQFLGVNVESIRDDRKISEYRVRTSSIITNQTIRNYLLQYPLNSSKHLNFNDWSTIFAYFEKGAHWNNVDHIVKLKNGMNNSRTNFNWDHLSRWS
jgi:hypothetical protein